MKLNHKLIKIAFIIFYALSILLVPSNTAGEITILPEIDGNGPQLNGNLTAEWEDSVRYNADFNGNDANVFVQVNGSHIFVAFNYTSTSSPLIPVNDTLPTYPGYNLDYNNATHDWLALQFDNNLDRENIATQDSPDDILSIDQYRNETFDGLIQGNITHPIVKDSDVNSTNIGTDEGNGFRSNYSEFVFINEVDEVEHFTTVYEFVKPLASSDINGSDVDVYKTNILQFKFLYWMNQTANETIAFSQSTEWFTMRLNDTGTGINTKLLSETRIDIFMASADSSEFSGFNTILDQYGFDTVIHADTNVSSIATNDLSILLLGSTGFSEIEIQNLIDNVKIGGTLLLFLDDEASLSNTMAEKFGLTHLSNNIIVPSGINQSENLLSLTFSNDLPFMDEPSSATNKSISNIKVTTSKGFNITGLNDLSVNRYLLSQDYHLYNLFNLPSDSVYDENNNLIVDETETNNGISAGVAIDFVQGGRVAMFPSSMLASNANVTEGDFATYLLRLIPWVSRTVNTLNVQEMTISTHHVNRGESVFLSINVTDEFESTFPDSIEVNVTSKLSLGGDYIKTVSLDGSGSDYSNEMEINRVGFMTIETTAFLLGYGFVKGPNQELVSEFSVGTFNDLSNLSYILAGFFLTTILIVFVTYQKTK